MIKAIFLDYTGTMVREDDPYTKQLLKIFITSSSLQDPKEALRVVWGMIKKSEWEDYQETFIKKDEMVERILDICEKEYQFCADRKTVHDIWRDSWIHAPLFDDVKPFVQRCSLPVYVVTNDDLCYVEQSLREKELSVAGIISAESVRACKPHKEILEEAVRVAAVDPSEAVMIGDSETSDVKCALESGIVPILLDRKGTSDRTDIQVVRSLEELSF